MYLAASPATRRATEFVSQALGGGGREPKALLRGTWTRNMIHIECLPSDFSGLHAAPCTTFELRCTDSELTLQEHRVSFGGTWTLSSDKGSVTKEASIGDCSVTFFASPASRRPMHARHRARRREACDEALEAPLGADLIDSAHDSAETLPEQSSRLPSLRKGRSREERATW
mmetsp:Transcript_3562/g.7712  ORF Transcript_3562/g.7712 Transcript_3562/m.7712 type:complete len:172 (-) Transcript_3562:104-619(-)